MCKANYTCDEYVWTQSLTNYSPTKKTIENTVMSLTKTNFQPCKPTRTAKSMSSTVVLSFQPPASSIAANLHTPAVPAKLQLYYL